MNDLLNYNTKPSSTEELFRVILKVVEKNYNEIVPLNVKERKNKDNAKMTDSEIITIYLLIECKGKSLNAGYSLLKK